MGITSAALALLRQQALAPQQPQPVAQPVYQPEVQPEATPMEQASEAQALSVDALSGARALGNAWTDLVSAPAPVVEAPAPVPSLAETGFSAEQNQALQDAALRMRIAQAGGQEAYDRQLSAAAAWTPEQRAGVERFLEQARTTLGAAPVTPAPAANDLARTVSAEAITEGFVGFYNRMADYYTAYPPQTGPIDLANFL